MADKYCSLVTVSHRSLLSCTHVSDCCCLSHACVSTTCWCPVLHRLTINTASSSPHGYNPLQELGGFDFETGSTTLETPTFSKSGGGRDAGSSSSFTRRWVRQHAGSTETMELDTHSAKPLLDERLYSSSCCNVTHGHCCPATACF